MIKIPKIIHYSWFGPKPIPEIFKKCYSSWQKYCPDYEFRFWNEENFNFKNDIYLREHFPQSKYAQYNDYARLKIIHDHGGFYLDIDVELIKSIDDLLKLECYFGFQEGNFINSGNGFGAIKKHRLLNKMIAYYDSEEINFESSYSYEPAPQKETRLLEKLGLYRNNQYQEVEGAVIFPTEYFCPAKKSSMEYLVTKNTYSIHHYSGSWLDYEIVKANELSKKFVKIVPNFIGVKLSRIIQNFIFKIIYILLRIRRRGLNDSIKFLIKKVLKRRNYNG